MKRALIVLLLLAVAGGLFAQSVAFSGHAISGIMVAVPNEGDTTFHVYNPDPGAPYRFRFNAAATTASGNAGATGRLHVTPGAISGEYGYAWLKPLDTLTLYGGKMDNNNWGTGGGFDADGGVGSQTGVLVRFDPIAGLSLGASVNPKDLEIAKTDFRVGLKYSMASLFNAVANLTYDGSAKDGDGKTDANVGFDYVGLSGLGLSKLAVDVQAVDLSDLLWLGIGPRIHFALGDFSAGVRAKVFLPMGDSEEDLDAAATVWGQYVLGSITAKLGIGYELNGAPKAANETGSFEYREWDGLPGAIGGGENSLLIAKPSVTFNIGGGSLEVGYSLTTEVGGDNTRHAIFAGFNVGF